MLVTYQGGPIVRCPNIYSSYWGPAWSDGPHSALAGQLNQFLQDLVGSQFMNVLTQYGISGTGLYAQASFLPGVPSTLTVSDYQGIIQSCIDAGVFPSPQDPRSSTIVSILIIFLDENTIINGGGRQLNFPGAPDIGFHDSFPSSSGNPVIYAFVAYSADVNFGTVVASHEFAEMITDPLYNAWTPDGGFHEIGDYCEGNNASINVGGRTWTVQTEWSDVDNFCRAEAPNPIPAISPGPAGATQLALDERGRGPRIPRFLSHERVLPLPPVHFDVNAKAARHHEEDLKAYQRKLFHPLQHEHLFADLPGFLRQVASLLEADKKPTVPDARQSLSQVSTTDRPRGSVRPG
jgi:hypothetical protein